MGEILERLCAGNLEPHLSELAHHFCQAAASGVAQKAVDYAVRAGKRAMRLLAYEEAVGGFELALRTLELVAEPREDTRCELLLALGNAQAAAGDRTKSQETFIQAVDAARAAGNAEKLAEAALGLGRQSAFVEGFEATWKTHHPLVQVLEVALASLPAGDSPLRAKLLCRLATATFGKPGSDERWRSLVREAVEMAERLGDGGTLSTALIHKRAALMGPGDAAERLADATRVLRLAAEIGDQERELEAREARLYDLLELGDVTAADVEVERIEELARTLRQPRYLADAEMIYAMRMLMDGKFDEGGELARRALALNQRVRPEIAVTLYGGQMYRTVWREKGRLAELETGTKAILEQVGPMPAAICALAFLCSEQGKKEEARAAFERVAADDFSSIQIPHVVAWSSHMANLTEICCFLGDLPRAEVLYEQLLPFAAMNIVLGPVPQACSGPVAHFLGMLAATMGRTNNASEHFAYALEMETKLRMPAMRARTQYEYGRMLARSDRPDDAKRGARLLTAALETARSLGMPVLEQKLSAVLAKSSVGTDRGSDTAAQTSPESARPLIRREGDYWTIAYEGRTFRLKDTKGLAYLAELLRSPAREFFALDLAQVDKEHDGSESQRIEAVTSVERARQSVTIAIRATLKKISENSPALGRHLASTVKTGKFCAYTPDPDSPSTWDV